jgi:hypothetical protein
LAAFWILVQIIFGPNLRKNHKKQDGHKKVVGPIKEQEAEQAHGGRVVASNINHALSEAKKKAGKLRQGSYGRQTEAPATTKAGTPAASPPHAGVGAGTSE